MMSVVLPNAENGPDYVDAGEPRLWNVTRRFCSIWDRRQNLTPAQSYRRQGWLVGESDEMRWRSRRKVLRSPVKLNIRQARLHSGVISRPGIHSCKSLWLTSLVVLQAAEEPRLGCFDLIGNAIPFDHSACLWVEDREPRRVVAR